VRRGWEWSRWALEGELPNVLGGGSEERLDPDGVEAPTACSAKPTALLAVTEERLDPRLSLPDEPACWSGSEVGNGAIVEPAVIRSRHRSERGIATASRLEWAGGTVGGARAIDDERVPGGRGRPTVAREGCAIRASVAVRLGVVDERRARYGARIATALTERDRCADRLAFQPLVVVDRPVLWSRPPLRAWYWVMPSCSARDVGAGPHPR
jgi:hypothetical protein